MPQQLIHVNTQATAMEATSFKNASTAVSDVLCAIDFEKTDVSSFTGFVECLEEFQTMIEQFVAMSIKDANNLIILRDTFIGVDTDLSGRVNFGP